MAVQGSSKPSSPPWACWGLWPCRMSKLPSLVGSQPSSCEDSQLDYLDCIYVSNLINPLCIHSVCSLPVENVDWPSESSPDKSIFIWSFNGKMRTMKDAFKRACYAMPPTGSPSISWAVGRNCCTEVSFLTLDICSYGGCYCDEIKSHRPKNQRSQQNGWFQGSCHWPGLTTAVQPQP